MGALAGGAPLDGAALASRALALNRFDDGAHELLVRCLARAGEVSAARDHAEACEVLFRRSFMHPLGANRAYDHLADVAHGEQTSLH